MANIVGCVIYKVRNFMVRFLAVNEGKINMRQDRYEGDGNQYGANYDEGRADARYRNDGYGPNNNNAIVRNNNPALNNLLSAHLRPRGGELQVMLDQVGEAGDVAQPHQYRNQEQKETGVYLMPWTGIGRQVRNGLIEKRKHEGEMMALQANARASEQRVEVARDLSMKIIDAETTRGLKAADLFDNEQKRSHKQLMKDKDIGMKREQLAHDRNLNESKQAHDIQLVTLESDLKNRNNAAEAERQERLLRVQAQLERENMQAQAAFMRGQGIPARQRPAAAEEPARQRRPGFFNGSNRPEGDEGADAEQGFANN